MKFKFYDLHRQCEFNIKLNNITAITGGPNPDTSIITCNNNIEYLIVGTPEDIFHIVSTPTPPPGYTDIKPTEDMWYDEDGTVYKTERHYTNPNTKRKFKTSIVDKKIDTPMPITNGYTLELNLQNPDNT